MGINGSTPTTDEKGNTVQRYEPGSTVTITAEPRAGVCGCPEGWRVGAGGSLCQLSEPSDIGVAHIATGRQAGRQAGKPSCTRLCCVVQQVACSNLGGPAGAVAAPRPGGCQATKPLMHLPLLCGAWCRWHAALGDSIVFSLSGASARGPMAATSLAVAATIPRVACEAFCMQQQQSRSRQQQQQQVVVVAAAAIVCGKRARQQARMRSGIQAAVTTTLVVCGGGYPPPLHTSNHSSSSSGSGGRVSSTWLRCSKTRLTRHWGYLICLWTLQGSSSSTAAAAPGGSSSDRQQQQQQHQAADGGSTMATFWTGGS